MSTVIFAVAVAAWAPGVDASTDARGDDQGLTLGRFPPRVEDWYYPAEEPAQRAGLKIPSLAAIEGDVVSLTLPGEAAPVRVLRGSDFHGWRLMETLDQPPAP